MTDYERIEEELVSRGYDESSEVFKAVLNLCYVLDSHDLTDEGFRRLVVDQFHELNTDRSVRISSMMRLGSRWGAFHLGNAPIGAVLRVRHGAFTSDPGRRYNGLVGRLITGRGGRAVVRFIGHQDEIGHYIDPSKLEILLSTDKETS